MNDKLFHLSLWEQFTFLNTVVIAVGLNRRIVEKKEYKGFSEGVSEGVLTVGQPHKKNVVFKEFFEEAGS